MARSRVPDRVRRLMVLTWMAEGQQAHELAALGSIERVERAVLGGGEPVAAAARGRHRDLPAATHHPPTNRRHRYAARLE
ncbi:hypothetical protein, partial [Desertimonas flava]|uniref:hypothetical protein n=1 Tax=Desertimonas flava TaxID=2064846 RepID=UPI0023EF5BE5